MKGHSLHNNTPLPPDDPFSDFIQHDLDLDRLPGDQHLVFGEADDREALDEDKDEVEPSPSSSRFSSPLPASSHPSRFDLRHNPTLVRRQPSCWWQQHLDDLFTLLIVVLLLAAWLGGKVEHQQTVDNLNATISAQQAIIVQQQATLAAADGRP